MDSEVTLSTVDGGDSMAVMDFQVITALDLSTLVAGVNGDLVVDILTASEGGIPATDGVVVLRGGEVLLTKMLGRPVVPRSQWRPVLTLSSSHSSRVNNNNSNNLAVHKMKRSGENSSMELERPCPVSWSHSA